MPLNKSPEEWAKVDPIAVCADSRAQLENVLAMALADIAEMGRELERVKDHKAASFLGKTGG